MNLDIYRRILAGESLTFALTPRALWRLTGPDSLRYLNGQVTCDVAAIGKERAGYAAVCTAKGRMEGDLHIAVHGDEFYLDADAALHESLGARLEKYLIADDAVFEDISGLWSLSHVFGTTPPPAPGAGFVISSARFGLPGHDLWSAGSGAVIVGDSIAGDVIETLRLEHGLPKWGAELTETTLPPEAGPPMLDAISYTKGCYVGQETIARLKSVGHVNRTLVFLKSDSASFPPAQTKLTQDGTQVGVITSAGFSPRLEKGIALGYVRHQITAVGTLLQAGDLKLTISTPLFEAEKA